LLAGGVAAVLRPRQLEQGHARVSLRVRGVGVRRRFAAAARRR